MTQRRFLPFASLLLVVGALAFLLSDTEVPEYDDSLVRLGDAAQIEAGRYLAVAGNCASCHTAAGGEYMAGGLEFETPFGVIYSTNITPEEGTGIGGWSPQDFYAAMRHGVAPGGRHLYPVFPYTAYTKVTDKDLAALYTYLMSIPAVSRSMPDNDLLFPFNLRRLMSIWKKLFLTVGPDQPDSEQRDEWNRGRYLVEGLAHCSACHSPRNLLGAEESDRAMSGGVYIDRVPSGERRPWSAPNLTSAHAGLGIWSRDDLTQYLKTGRNSMVDTFGPMNEVIMNSTRHLRDEDVAAMAVYLKSLPAIETSSTVEPDARTLGMGRTLYNLHCGTCHLPTGLGDPEMAPTIGGGSLVVRTANPASLINVILYSPESPHPPLPGKWRNPMDEFQYLLDDEEVAALATFVRHSWDNSAGPVTADEVAEQR